MATIRGWRKNPVNTLSNHKKIIFSVSCLFSLLFFLSSIEYISYINNKEEFNIENNFINDSIRDKVLNLRKEITYCKSYINAYYHISEELKKKEYIGYSNIDDFYFTVINDDTIEIKLNERRPHPGGGINSVYINKGINDAEDIGILLKNESYNISHPTSKVILKSMQQKDSIKGDDFSLLVHQKIERYQNRINEYQKMLEDEVVITFGDFIIYSIFNTSITGNKTNIIIRLIFLLQAIVVTFFSGYIYQTLYKILDGEDNQKPKA